MTPKLLVIELHHLGDAVLAVPFLRSAQARFAVTVLCRPSVAEFLRVAVPGLEIREAPESWHQLIGAVRSLRLTAADAAICVWADARAHLLMLLSGAGRRAGFPMNRVNYYAPDLPWRKRRLRFGQVLGATAAMLTGRPLLTDRCQRPRTSQSHLESWAQLARCLGVEPDYSLPWIPGNDTAPDLADFLLRWRDRKIILVHPGGRLPTKRWPYFPALLKRLAEGEDFAALIIQPPGEPAPESVGESQRLLPTQDFPGLMALTRSSDAVVCNDSFASHLAAALGKPVVAVFGSGNPDWFAPYGSADRIAATNACPHRPCIDRCVMPSIVCLETVTVDLVESQLRRVWNAG